MLVHLNYHSFLLKLVSLLMYWLFSPVILDLKMCSQYWIVLKTDVDGICRPPLFTKVVKYDAFPHS